MTDEPAAEPLYGMAAVKEALKRRAPGERSVSWLSKALGLSRGAALQWDEVPVEWIEKITVITGVPARVLRPDLVALFAAE